jgi:5-methylcytosine-specific restriction enzyme subunit McrC
MRIQVFEYENLIVNEVFTENHLIALGKYNDESGRQYFKLGYKSIQFQQYVGVIQVGDLTIEILPKISRQVTKAKDKNTWQKVLIDMLQECNWMTVYTNQKANLQYKYNSILEAYLELFINECEFIVQQGLIKKYTQFEGNRNSLKGKLLFSKNIQQNLIHQERFYTRHVVYDRNNIYNQILFKALNLIPQITNNPFLNDRLYSLLLNFPELDDIYVNYELFSNLVFDRKSVVYQEAINIASMILLNYRPDVIAGNNNLLAILFDMNDLWEEYVYRQLLRYVKKGVNIFPKDSKIVWKKEGSHYHYKRVIPDLALVCNHITLIIDTKWKIPENDMPNDADLKQMFIYNEYWSSNALLFYPQESGNDFYEAGVFLGGGRITGSDRHKCGIFKASVLQAKNDYSTLDLEFGARVLSRLENENLI